MHYEVCLVPSQDGVPPGEVNPYRYMDEEEREAILLNSFLRILRDLEGAESAQPIPPGQSESP